MNWPWRTKTEMNVSEFSSDPDDARFGWQAADEGDAPGGEGDNPQEPQEPELPELDDAVRAQVEAYYGRQAERQREVMQAAGLDLASDGQPVIRDVNRFAAWSGLGSRQPSASQPSAVSHQPSDPKPDTRYPIPNTGEPTADLTLDPLTMTGADMETFIDRRIQKATQPLLQQNEELRGQIQRQSARDALGSVREALEQYSPEIAGIIDHPDFAERYRQEAQNLPAWQLENPEYKAALAGGLLPYLRASPNTPPGWTAAPQPSAIGRQLSAADRQQQQARDDQGRFTEVARNMGNRQNVGQVPQARGGMAPPQPRDGAMRETERFLQQFKSNAPGRVRNKQIGPNDVEAITSLTDDPMRAGQQLDYEEWKVEQARLSGGRR